MEDILLNFEFNFCKACIVLSVRAFISVDYCQSVVRAPIIRLNEDSVYSNYEEKEAIYTRGKVSEIKGSKGRYVIGIR